MDGRTHSPEPPPRPDEVRRELGWSLISADRQPDRAERD